MAIEIESGIPITKVRKSVKFGSKKYRFHELKVGQSIHFKIEDGYSLRNTSSAANASKYGKFIVRTVDETDVKGPGIRVWKVGDVDENGKVLTNGTT